MVSKNDALVNSPFSSQLWKSIDKSISNILTNFQPPYIAAFDADGTLWPMDLGQWLYDYQKFNSLLPVTTEELNQQHGEYSSRSSEELYLWQAELCHGFSPKQIMQWAQQSRKSFGPFQYFSDQKKLIKKLDNAGFDIFVVSASFNYTILESAELMGINKDQIIGVELSIVDGLFEKPALPPLPIGAGKVDSLLKKTNGIKPVFSVGNSMGDLDLLESSMSERLIIHSAHPEDEIFASEQQIMQIAQKRGWLVQSMK